MIVDGRKIAEEIFQEIKAQVNGKEERPVLAVFTCAPNFETKKFLSIKKNRAEELGILIDVTELPLESTTEDIVSRVKAGAHDADGIIIQLPFPEHINKEELMKSVPETHDVDAFHIKDSNVLPPVVGAIEEIVLRNNVDVEGKNCVVVGNGSLVGAPSAEWLESKGANVTMLTRDSGDITEQTKEADIIILGAGKPGLLKPEMIKDGVVILDAGTSEEGGVLAGDADPKCAEKASLFTPVPGGIGPITIAVLFKNLLTLYQKKVV